MAFDAIVTRAMVKELNDLILLGKIDKIYQPIRDELVINIHTKRGNKRIFASASSNAPRLHFIDYNTANPATPFAFCMLLRKHLSGGRIIAIKQKDCERIIEFSFETLNELGFTLGKKLIFEIMGKHSNIILVDTESGNIVDAIKRVSIDTSRARQVLPGMRYEYPPAQDKIGFDELTFEEFAALQPSPKIYLNTIGGISPAIARELADMALNRGKQEAFELIKAASQIGNAPETNLARDSRQEIKPVIYYEDKECTKPLDYHVMNLNELEQSAYSRHFDSISECIDSFFSGKINSSLVKQRSHDLYKKVQTMYDKAVLKKQKLSEDLISAQDSEYLRLYGEILTANLHAVKPGISKVKLVNYYDGSEIEIPLDTRFSASKNAQIYFKKYGKSKTAIKEKTSQLKETQADIDYLDSVLSFLDEPENSDDIEAVRAELVEGGYLRPRKLKGKAIKLKPSPHRYKSPSGFDILVGRNNKENDLLTLKTASKSDIWLHTKDIPGSHVILKTNGENAAADDIYCAAAIAAWHSKAKSSANVAVDYVPVRYVKKPSGAKPGMVIFTNNRTVYIDPALPKKTD
mgnify:FL=1